MLGFGLADHQGGATDGTARKPARRKLRTPNTNQGADPEGHLYGCVIVFTGRLSTMTRQQAWDKVAQAGGTPEPNITRRTSIVVIATGPRAGKAPTGKARRAAARTEAGQSIELMTEAELRQHLPAGAAWLQPPLPLEAAGPG